MARFSSAASAEPQGASLFNLPIPLPVDSIYSQLNLDSSASSTEVEWAAKILNDERKVEKAKLEEEVKKTIAKVPGLQEALDEWKKVQNSGSTDNRGLQRLAELENRALGIDPNFQENRRKAQDLGEKINELNGKNLGNKAELVKYDESHPPFALMKLAPVERDAFLKRPREALWILRREISQFLEQRGEAGALTNDLDREDFSADFCRNPLLDGDV